MTQYLTLSRAAKLVGTKRGALQKKIRAGEMTAFEGMLEISELEKAYPNVELEDSTMLEKVDRFIENALTKKFRSDAILPDSETLLERIGLLSQELVASKAEVNRYAALMESIKPKVAELGVSDNKEDMETVRAFKSWFLQALEGEESFEELPDSLLVRDAFLRVMSAHVSVTPGGQEFFSEGSINLLEAALRGGVALPYGCTDANCGRCKVKLISGGIHRSREDFCALQQSEIDAGYFLSCCHSAVTDVVIDASISQSGDDLTEQMFDVQVQSVQRTGAVVVLQTRYRDASRLQFLSGQYARIQFEDGSSSLAGIASCPCDDRNLEFHLSGASNSGFWRYANEALETGQLLSVKAPYGDFVLDTTSSRPLIFVAVDAGFAAVKSLIEHAMAVNAADSIQLYWITTDGSEPYLSNLCRSWEDALDEFTYKPVILGQSIEMTQHLADTLLIEVIDLPSHDIYICALEDDCTRMSKLLKTRAAVPDRRIMTEPVRAN